MKSVCYFFYAPEFIYKIKVLIRITCVIMGAFSETHTSTSEKIVLYGET
jgi:hypothetical protein